MTRPPDTRSPLWAPLALAGSFLTIIPAPLVAADGRTVARAAALFPLVGALLGLGLGAVGLALDLVLFAGPAAVALLVLGAVLTGGLHLDGLMDSADGLFGGRTRERRLEIMRDSRVGSFGVLAGVLVLLGQYSCLALLAGRERLVALALALAAGRWAMVALLTLLPPARPDGLAAWLRGDGGRGPLIVATLGLIAATLGLVAVGVATVPVGVAIVVAAALGALLVGWLAHTRIGGATGDTCGAAAVVAETLALGAAAALR